MAYASWSGTVQPIKASAITAKPSIAESLDALAKRSTPARTIYVCHAPPADTPLDQMPREKHIGSKGAAHVHRSPRAAADAARP